MKKSKILNKKKIIILIIKQNIKLKKIKKINFFYYILKQTFILILLNYFLCL